MEQQLDLAFAKFRLNLIEDFLPLALVGCIHIEKERTLPIGFYISDDGLGPGQRGFEVEVDADNVHARG